VCYTRATAGVDAFVELLEVDSVVVPPVPVRSARKRALSGPARFLISAAPGAARRCHRPLRTTPVLTRERLALPRSRPPLLLPHIVAAQAFVFLRSENYRIGLK
jgi:hypothetical protein